MTLDYNKMDKYFHETTSFIKTFYHNLGTTEYSSIAYIKSYLYSDDRLIQRMFTVISNSNFKVPPETSHDKTQR